MKKKLILFLFLINSMLTAAQQRDTIVLLKSVEINGYKPTASDRGVITQQLDTTPLAKIFNATLSEQLSREGNVFIKTNNPGGVATLSVGGSNASQTSLLWNGVLLNNPMLGLYDYSLIPSFLFSQASIQYGGNGATQGNASIGGSVQLQSQPGAYDGYATELVMGIGSFHQQQLGVASHFSEEGIKISTRAYFQQNKNDYPFQDLFGQTQHLQNAALNQQGFSQDVQLGDEKNNLSVHTWYLKNEYQIPGSLLQSYSVQKQNDEAVRTALSWNKQFKKFNFIWNLGYTNDKIRFVDSLISFDEKSKSYSVQSDFYIEQPIGKYWKNSYRLNYNYTEAYTDAYSEKQQLQTINVIAKTCFEKNKVYASLSNRGSWYNNDIQWFMPALDIKWKFVKQLALIVDAARIYRNPTLNDLYWQPGGNPNLKTESGWNQSAGIEVNHQTEKWKYQLQSVAFYAEVQNEIIWTPNPTGLYTPQNVNESKTTGVRTFASIKRFWKSSNLNLWMNASYGNYLVKQNASSKAYQDKIYTPHELYKWGLVYMYKKVQLNYYGSYVGYRFITTDNSSWVNPYLIHDATISYSFEIKNSDLQFYFGCKNILNESYQIVSYRPMPGRSYQAGVRMVLK